MNFCEDAQSDTWSREKIQVVTKYWCCGSIGGYWIRAYYNMMSSRQVFWRHHFPHNLIIIICSLQLQTNTRTRTELKSCYWNMVPLNFLCAKKGRHRFSSGISSLPIGTSEKSSGEVSYNFDRGTHDSYTYILPCMRSRAQDLNANTMRVRQSGWAEEAVNGIVKIPYRRYIILCLWYFIHLYSFCFSHYY